jgi:RND family efflux transporter MFP subunit
VLVVIAGAFVVGYWPKKSARAALELATTQGERAARRVDAVTPKVGSSDRALALPGSVQPLEETIVYSRANGYVRRWVVDIGDKVKEGQLLAELDTPELDQEMAQAEAQLAQAQAVVVQSKANRDFSATNLERYKQLAPTGVASQQELEQHQAQASVDEANVQVALATVNAQQANIRRLSQLKSFSRVVAPFGGTVTTRMIERGSLVTSGNATPMFKIASTDPVRVFVQVPQDIAPSVRIDVPAKVNVREYAGKPFDGKVARAAGALDSASRTMNTEVRVPNPDGKLLAGMYAEVSLTLPLPHRILELPATTLLNDAKGLRVVTLDADNKVHLVRVVVERDTGSTIEISSGLEGNERVVKLANPSLVEGEQVEVAAR